jgi:hypothetical protein
MRSQHQRAFLLTRESRKLDPSFGRNLSAALDRSFSRFQDSLPPPASASLLTLQASRGQSSALHGRIAKDFMSGLHKFRCDAENKNTIL